jgi:hypothetical protein
MILVGPIEDSKDIGFIAQRIVNGADRGNLGIATIPEAVMSYAQRHPEFTEMTLTAKVHYEDDDGMFYDKVNPVFILKRGDGKNMTITTHDLLTWYEKQPLEVTVNKYIASVIESAHRAQVQLSVDEEAINQAVREVSNSDGITGGLIRIIAQSQ